MLIVPFIAKFPRPPSAIEKVPICHLLSVAGAVAVAAVDWEPEVLKAQLVLSSVFTVGTQGTNWG